MGEDMELKPCPCGETPTSLTICDAGQGGKWAFVYGDCCCEWHVEFRTQYLSLGSDECMELGIKEWNNAPRATNRSNDHETEKHAST